MNVLRPLKAIRAKCVWCSGGSWKEVKLCEIEDCTLWPYRFGRRPKTKGKKVAPVSQNGLSSRKTPSRLANFTAN
jgi:hypothetical protein